MRRCIGLSCGCTASSASRTNLDFQRSCFAGQLVTKPLSSTVRLAATWWVNQQPVLLSGILVRLGSVAVVPYFRHNGHAVADVPVACARITVYSDQWPQDWDGFSDHPFKQVLSKLPPLQACRITSAHATNGMVMVWTSTRNRCLMFSVGSSSMTPADPPKHLVPPASVSKSAT